MSSEDSRGEPGSPSLYGLEPPRRGGSQAGPDWGKNLGHIPSKAEVEGQSCYSPDEALSEKRSTNELRGEKSEKGLHAKRGPEKRRPGGHKQGTENESSK